jgi:leader peptidase (prepilin peptidase) / N-methyltransferase
MDVALALGTAFVLVLVSAEDLRRRIIPNRIVLPAWVLALSVNTMLHPDHAAAWFGWSFGAAFCFLLFARITGGGLGMGDVKLVGFLGAVLGAQVVPALIVGTSLGAIAAALILLRHGNGARTRTFAYGPFLAAGGLAMLFF